MTHFLLETRIWAHKGKYVGYTAASRFIRAVSHKPGSVEKCQVLPPRPLLTYSQRGISQFTSHLVPCVRHVLSQMLASQPIRRQGPTSATLPTRPRLSAGAILSAWPSNCVTSEVLSFTFLTSSITHQEIHKANNSQDPNMGKLSKKKPKNATNSGENPGSPAKWYSSCNPWWAS